VSELVIAELHVYPIKSCRGAALPAVDVGRAGLRHDRRWMIVDERGMFVAQRGVGALGVGIRAVCLIAPEIRDAHGTLRLCAPGMPPLVLPLAGGGGPARDVQIWRRSRPATDQGEDAADWCTTFLSRERPGRYRLVRLADDGDTDGAPGGGPGAGTLGFADTAPVLVISQASLDALNRRLAAPVPMNRFRPNIVLAGGDAHVEDALARFSAGTVTFVGAGLCVRCAMPTIDQDTADQASEPLRTLATYRATADGVVFGRHFGPAGPGAIAVGDGVRTEPGPARS
jgi:uncharacterized protein YcbX